MLFIIIIIIAVSPIKGPAYQSLNNFQNNAADTAA